MERLKMMKENLMSCVQAQMSDIKNADAQELGEAVDMIKDLSEAIYYCTIVDAMKEKDSNKYYNEPRYTDGNRYYGTPMTTSVHYYTEPRYEEEIR